MRRSGNFQVWNWGKLRWRLATNDLRNPLVVNTEDLDDGLEQVEEEIEKLRSTLPETMRLKEAELSSQKDRLDNLIEFVAEGRGSKALGKALDDAERRVESLQEEIASLTASRERVFKVPPPEWIEERILKLQGVLEQNTEKSALLLRDILGPIRLEPVHEEGKKPFYPG